MDKKVLKNYIILVVIIVLTLLATFYVLTWYKHYNDAKLKTPVITEVLTEVSLEDIEDISRERNFLMVYACTSSEMKCRSFESKFKSYVKENNLNDNMVYLNLGYDKDDKNALNNLYTKYKSDDLTNTKIDYPTILVFSDGKIVNILRSTKDGDFSMKAVKNFLSGYEL